MLELRRSEKEISISERHQIIQDYLSSGKSKADIWFKYTGEREEHGRILRWMRMYGYGNPKESHNFVSIMPKNKNSENENQKLQKRIKALEKQLEDEKLRSYAYSTMIDIAEKELKISIRKK